MARMGLAQGFTRTLPLFQDVIMEKLREKIDNERMDKRSLLDRENAELDRQNKLADTQQAGIFADEKAAAEDKMATKRKADALQADLDSDTSLAPAVKARVQGIAKQGTPEAIDRAQSILDTERKPKDQVAEFKRQIADLGGWDAAAKANPELVRKAEVYGVKRETVKEEKVAAADRLPTAKELVNDALMHVTGQEKSAQAIAAKMVADGEDPAVASETAKKIIGLDPDKRKAAITYLKTEGKMRNPAVADSLAAAWSQPGDFVAPVADTTGAGDKVNLVSLDQSLKEAGPVASSTATPGAEPTAARLPAGDKVPLPAAPGAGMATPEQEAKLKEQQARTDRILREMEQELGIAQ
jgi:hypothetical protein